MNSSEPIGHENKIWILFTDIEQMVNAFEEIIKASNTIDNFGLMAPISSNLEYPNYKADNPDTNNHFKIKCVIYLR